MSSTTVEMHGSGSRGKGRGLLRFGNGSAAVDASPLGVSRQVEWVSSTWPADMEKAGLLSAALNNNNNNKTSIDHMHSAVKQKNDLPFVPCAELDTDIAANSLSQSVGSKVSPVIVAAAIDSTLDLNIPSVVTASSNSSPFSASVEHPFFPRYSWQLQQPISEPINVTATKAESTLKTVPSHQVSGHPFSVVPLSDGSSAPAITSPSMNNNSAWTYLVANDQTGSSNMIPCQKMSTNMTDVCMKGIDELSASGKPVYEVVRSPQSSMAELYPLLTNPNVNKTVATDQYPANFLPFGMNPQDLSLQTQLSVPLSLIPLAMAQTLIAQNQMPPTLPLNGPVPYPIADGNGVSMRPRPPPGLENVLPLQPDKLLQLSQLVPPPIIPLVSTAEMSCSEVVPKPSNCLPTVRAESPLLAKAHQAEIQQSVVSKPLNRQASSETSKTNEVSELHTSLNALAKVFVPKAILDESVVDLLGSKSNPETIMENVRTVLSILESSYPCDNIEASKLQLCKYLTDVSSVSLLSRVVDEIYLKSVTDESFCYIGASVCAFLTSNLSLEGGSFWKLLLERCFVDFASHREMMLAFDRRSFVCNFSLFIAELMLACKTTSGATCSIFAKFLTEIMHTLMSTGGVECYTTVVRVLKLSGYILDQTEYKSAVDDIIRLLRLAICDSGSNRSIRALMLSVVEQRAGGWFQSAIKGEQSTTSLCSSDTACLPGTRDEFYSPMSEMRYVDEHGQMQQGEDSFVSQRVAVGVSADGLTSFEDGFGDQSDSFDLSWDQDYFEFESDDYAADMDEMDPEIADAYEIFLQESLTKKNNVVCKSVCS